LLKFYYLLSVNGFWDPEKYFDLMNLLKRQNDEEGEKSLLVSRLFKSFSFKKSKIAIFILMIIIQILQKNYHQVVITQMKS
jgi:hypothetical protein